MKAKGVHTVEKIFLRLATCVAGGLFLFSGGVKAVDPVGMCLKLEAYARHFGLPLFADGLSLRLAVAALALIEVMLGINLLLGMCRRRGAIAGLLFTLALTAVALYTYLKNPVADCGCFGDALHLTHTQTLLKNIALLTVMLWIVLRQRLSVRWVSARSAWLVDIWTFVFTVGVMLTALHKGSLIDFTAFHAGADFRAAMEGQVEGRSGKQLASFYVQNAEGDDVTDSIVFHPGHLLLLTLPHEATANEEGYDRIETLYDFARNEGIPFIALSAEGMDAAARWRERTGAAYPFYIAEENALRSLERSNPGIVWMENGRIIQKWSSGELPPHLSLGYRPMLTALPSTRRTSLRLCLCYGLPLLILLFLDNLWVGSIFYRKRVNKRKINKWTS